MSGHCIVLSLSTNLHQVWRQPFTCFVVIDWSVVHLVCANVTHRNLVDRGQKRTHKKTGHNTLSFAFWRLLFHPVTNGLIGAAVACAWLLTAGSMSSDSITLVSTPPVCAAVDVETRFGAAGSRLGRPLLRAGAQIVPDIFLSVADSFGSMPLQSSVGLYFSTKARVMYRRLTTTSPGRGFQGVPVTIFSALSFQRLPSTFRRTDRAETAPFSNPMMCSSLQSEFPSQIAVRQRSSSFVRSTVLGSLYQIASPNPAVSSQGGAAQDPSTVCDQPRQQWRLCRDLHLRFLSQVDAKTYHKSTEFLVHVLNRTH